MQSTGSAFPIVERQAQIVAERLSGRVGAAAASATCAAETRRRAASGRSKRWGDARPPDHARGLRPLHARARPRARGRTGASVSKRALVTGASGAFGTAVRDELRGRGWQVAGLDLRAEPATTRSSPATSPTPAAVPGAVAEAVARLRRARRAGQQRGHRRPGERRRGRRATTSRRCSTSTCSAPGRSRPRRSTSWWSRAGASCCSARAWRSSACRSAPPTACPSARCSPTPTRCARSTPPTSSVTCVHPAFVRTPIHDATRAAGLQLEGFSHEEPLEQVVATIVEACTTAASAPRRRGHARRAHPVGRRPPLPRPRRPRGRAHAGQADRRGRARRRRDRRRAARPARAGSLARSCPSA